MFLISWRSEISPLSLRAAIAFEGRQGPVVLAAHPRFGCTVLAEKKPVRNAYIPFSAELVGQKLGNSYANPCHSLPAMRLQMFDKSVTNTSKDGISLAMPLVLEHIGVCAG
ncbi:hypothetical protein [Pseudomonas sp. 58 R 3]|uniref:hypothetical protein n=1 Tax=Pseudomonas sp. 58 R 3 TaxID=1844108 RepID=UPI001111B9EB|nr:hypothetical protein [Pseudomonas sp. 58 R 3]